MRIFFTDHAKRRMVLRKITEGMVKIVLINPDDQGKGYQGKLTAFKKFVDEGIIKVVYLKTKDKWLIVSVIWHQKYENNL